MEGFLDRMHRGKGFANLNEVKKARSIVKMKRMSIIISQEVKGAPIVLKTHRYCHEKKIFENQINIR